MRQVWLIGFLLLGGMGKVVASVYPADTIYVYDTIRVYDTVRIPAPIPTLEPVRKMSWGVSPQGDLILTLDPRFQAQLLNFYRQSAATNSGSSIWTSEQNNTEMSLKKLTFATWLALGIQGIVLAQSETGIRVGITPQMWWDTSLNLNEAKFLGAEAALDYTFPLNDKHLWFRTGVELGVDFPGAPSLPNSVDNDFSVAYAVWADDHLERYGARVSLPGELLWRWDRLSVVSGFDLSVRQRFGNNAPPMQFTADVSAGVEYALTPSVQLRANFTTPINASGRFISDIPFDPISLDLPNFYIQDFWIMRAHLGVRFVLPNKKAGEA